MSFHPTSLRLSAICSFLLAIAAGALLLAGCGGGAQETEAGYALGDPVGDSTIAAIAEANGFTDTLTQTGLERNMNQLSQGRLPMLPDSIKEQVERVSVVRFLTTAAQISEARERGLEPDSGAVGQQLRQLRARVGSDSLFRARLAQSGMSMAELRRDIREQLLVRQLQQALAEEAGPPTAEEVQDYRTDQAREVRVQQILFELPPRATPAQRDSVQQRAQAVLDSIQSGTADFGAMAQRYSQGGGDAQGSLGFQTREQMTSTFAPRGQRGQQSPTDVAFVETAFALEDSGAVAGEPVRSRYGYHLIRQTGTRTGTLADSAQAAQQLARERQQESVVEAVEGLREEVTLRVNPERVTADMAQPLEQPQEGGD